MGVFGICAVTFLHSIIVCISVIVLLSNNIISMGLQLATAPKSFFFEPSCCPFFWVLHSSCQHYTPMSLFFRFLNLNSLFGCFSWYYFLDLFKLSQIGPIYMRCILKFNTLFKENQTPLTLGPRCIDSLIAFYRTNIQYHSIIFLFLLKF